MQKNLYFMLILNICLRSNGKNSRLLTKMTIVLTQFFFLLRNKVVGKKLKTCQTKIIQCQRTLIENN